MLILDGRVADARAEIGDRLAADISNAERAALLELLAVNEHWAARGRPRVSEPTAQEWSRASDWQTALLRARSGLVEGRYRSSSKALSTLVEDAPDLVSAARAIELRALANGALRRDDSEAETSVSQTETSPRPAAPDVWYGWQSLVSDAVAISTAPFDPRVGGAVYLTGAPIIHLAHGQFGTAAKSFGIRLGAPVVGGVGGLLVFMAGPCKSEGCLSDVVTAIGVGALVGGVSAIAFDAFVFSREKVEPSRSGAVGPFRLQAGPRQEHGRTTGLDVGLSAVW